MKVNVTLECTPEEARALFGLPDVQPFQNAVMAEMQSKVANGFTKMDPVEFFRGMMNQYAGGLEQLQGFLARLERAAGRSKE